MNAKITDFGLALMLAPKSTVEVLVMGTYFLETAPPLRVCSTKSSSTSVSVLDFLCHSQTLVQSKKEGTEDDNGSGRAGGDGGVAGGRGRVQPLHSWSLCVCTHYLLLEFYAPWCGHYQNMALFLDEVIVLLQKDEGATIAKMVTYNRILIVRVGTRDIVKSLFQDDSPTTLLAHVMGTIGSIEQAMLAQGRHTYKYFIKNHMLYEKKSGKVCIWKNGI
ncbi:kinase family protein [Zea mays]|uniref:Kinase family protein n=1 Tax=Zea mays TaxID=4577 RepID=A0A1D6GZJ9_MAIZE|nr:kinase family protein [Zea mays]